MKRKMRTLCGIFLAAAAALRAVAGADSADVSVADFPRLAGEAGDSARIMRAVDALRLWERRWRTRLARQLCS